jgi:hypothetical protein
VHEPLVVAIGEGISMTVETDNGGNYNADFASAGYDIQLGDTGEVHYVTQINYADVTYHRPFELPPYAHHVFLPMVMKQHQPGG